MPLHLNKPAIRVLGIAESFVRTRPRSVLAGIVMRADLRIDGAAFARITVGGDDATDGALQIFRKLDREDIHAILLNGNVISWFNILDPEVLYQELSLPVLSLTYGESEGLEKYIREYFPGNEDKLRRYAMLGPRERISLKTEHDVYLRAIGLTEDDAKALLNKFTLDGMIPEPLRVARLIARAILRAELEP